MNYDDWSVYLKGVTNKVCHEVCR